MTKAVQTLIHERGRFKQVYNNFNPNVYKLSSDTFDLSLKLLSPI